MIVGALLTGVIGLFVVIACAATLHVQGIEINDARDAARALEPLAGATAATLFGLGFLGAALLAAAIVPLSTAYSVSETFGRKADIDDSFEEARIFYLSFGAVVAFAAILVLIPGAPLIPILFLSQALNAVLLLVLLPFMRSLGQDRELMGEHALGPRRPHRHRPRPGGDRDLGAGARRAQRLLEGGLTAWNGGAEQAEPARPTAPAATQHGDDAAPGDEQRRGGRGQHGCLPRLRQRQSERDRRADDRPDRRRAGAVEEGEDARGCAAAGRSAGRRAGRRRTTDRKATNAASSAPATPAAA